MSMRKRYIRRFLLFVVLAVCLVGTTPVLAQDEPRPEELLATARFDQRLNEQVPLDLRFRDETGKEVELASYFTGKPVVLAMMYYNCPNICGIAVEDLLEKMRDVSFNLGTDYDVVTVSIDPRETPTIAAEKKETYVKHYNREGAKEGWHALTGDEATIQRLAQAVGFKYAWDDNLQQYAHPSGVVLLTAQGKISQYFYALIYKATDLRLGLVQASENKIGSLVDKILMRCYQYDPLTGQYTPVVMTIVRIMGAFIMLGLGGFLAWAVFWERRKRALAPGT